MTLRYRIAITSDLVDVEGFKTKGVVKREGSSIEVDVAIVSVKLRKAISPEEAKDVAELVRTYVKEVLKPRHEVVIVSGRLPLWLAMKLQHDLQHVVAATAIFDPKLAGAVVTSAHRYDVPVSEMEIIELPDDVRAQLTQ